MSQTLEQALAAHDQQIADNGIAVWIGAEPTFTQRHSSAPEWLSEALGADKLSMGLRLMSALRERHPGALVLRTLGRQYAGEPGPRWSLGLYAQRDGAPVWQGPPDPLDAEPGRPAGAGADLPAFGKALRRHLDIAGWRAEVLPGGAPSGLRLVARQDDGPLPEDPEQDPRLLRQSLHEMPTPASGAVDELAAEGVRLFIIGSLEETPCIDLPAFTRVEDFMACVRAIGDAANDSGLERIIMRGFPPPVDARVAWTTITPDPAVIEINQAPYADTRGFLAATRELHALAEKLGLSPYRLQFNGTVSDSGGGGQFTLGGPSAGASPFFLAPALLPRLIRYLNHHPSLSYWFAPDYVGSSSQSPRTDEGVRESFQELGLTLDLLERRADVSADTLWQTLSPFLTDPSGNPHRSELNIEKLWNPHLPARGRLGVVEFRAFRMAMTPGRAAAIAALLRALAAMLCGHDKTPRLKDWKGDLHDRFALPFYLLQDLRFVFSDLQGSGFGLDQAIKDRLIDDPSRMRWAVDFSGCRIEIEKAVEFWPLVGDVASQEGGGSRLVDASTARLQVLLRNAGDRAPPLDGWRVLAAGHVIPLRREYDHSGVVRLCGLRFRDFIPWRGLHPGLPAQGALNLTLTHPAVDEALTLSLHNWRADGGPYSGLPDSLGEAERRRSERLVVKRVPRSGLAAAKAPPEAALTPYSLDLRRL